MEKSLGENNEYGLILAKRRRKVTTVSPPADESVKNNDTESLDLVTGRF